MPPQPPVPRQPRPAQRYPLNPHPHQPHAPDSPMSTETNYPFKDSPSSASSSSAEAASPSIHLPFALLTAALAIVMINQTVSVFKQRTSLREGKAQLVEAYKNREPMVKQ